ncbi:MAG: regulatory iron-sulfur-containing complex subunit RicT [bacterium]|nr:regulatory iron-sulfur-containing complex subunit RicT [bacterium]
MNVVGVKFETNGRVIYCNNNIIELPVGSDVIVSNDKCLLYGKVVSFVESCDKFDYVVQRIATEQDKKIQLKNETDSIKAIGVCRNFIEKNKLEMRIINANYTFDRCQLIFKFVSDGRVDFRQLARDLGAYFKTRIELRQVGIRDKAKILGGIGPCGRFLCCSTYLNNFDSVSINMAKNQMLSLNPSKINGVCGRLLCCLNYEDESYSYLKSKMPAVGSLVTTNNGMGRVVSIDIFTGKYKVLIDDTIYDEEVKDDCKK